MSTVWGHLQLRPETNVFRIHGLPLPDIISKVGTGSTIVIKHTQVGEYCHRYDEANRNCVEQIIPPAVSGDGQPGYHAQNVGAENDDGGRDGDAGNHVLPRLGRPVALFRIDLGEPDGL